MDRSILRFNHLIELFISNYDGTAIGQDVRNMYENGSEYKSIFDRMKEVRFGAAKDVIKDFEEEIQKPQNMNIGIFL